MSATPLAPAANDLFADVGRASVAPFDPANLTAHFTGPGPHLPLIVSYGAGVDSTALIVEMINRGIRPERIFFADTGGEKDATHAYLDVFDAWLEARGLPRIERVRYVPAHAAYATLPEELFHLGTAPAITFGQSSCSIKYKQTPIAWALEGCKAIGNRPAYAAWDRALAAWSKTLPVVKAIGFDAGPKDKRRTAPSPDDKYVNWFALQDWGIRRLECTEIIEAAGLPLPPKSACVFCSLPTKEHELEWLAANEPHNFRLALDLETRALTSGKLVRDGVQKIDGFWGRMRKGDRRPASWRVWAAERGLIVETGDGSYDIVATARANDPFPDPEVDAQRAERQRDRIDVSQIAA